VTYDLVIRNGRVVVGPDLIECDIAATGGQIAAILAPGSRPAAAQTLDATGLVILPGVIDPHVHFGMGSDNDWETESRAAARGGVTTVLNYIQNPNSYLTVEPIERERAESASVVDFVTHFILMNEVHLAEIGSYIRDLDVSSFKYFTNFKGDEGAYLGIQGNDNGFLLALCREIARFPEGVLAVHTENIEIVWRLASELQGAGRDDLAAWSESRPDFVESHDMFTAFLLAEQTGCRIYIPHLSSAAGLEIYRRHRASGGQSVVETCPHYLTLTNEANLGSLGKVNPPLRSAADREALWAGIVDGTVATVGSDHNSRRRERKQGSIWKASAGFPGVALLLPLMLSEGFHKRGVSLSRIVDVISTNPARIFGLQASKGSIRVGLDADFTLVDLERRVVVDSKLSGSHSDYSIHDGWELRGWPVTTIVRGRVTMQDGDIVADGGHGRRVHRDRVTH
jgi:dihydropyrimidinase